MKRATVWRTMHVGEKIEAIGYEFEAHGIVLVVHDDGAGWCVTEPRTGRFVNSGRSRKDAMARTVIAIETYGVDRYKAEIEREAA